MVDISNCLSNSYIFQEWINEHKNDDIGDNYDDDDNDDDNYKDKKDDVVDDDNDDNDNDDDDDEEEYDYDDDDDENDGHDEMRDKSNKTIVVASTQEQITHIRSLFVIAGKSGGVFAIRV